MKRSLVVLSSLLFSVSTFVANSFADPITFTYTGSGSGSINGVAFGVSQFTIIQTGDTASRQSFGEGYSIDAASASIDILGVGTYSFVTGTRTFVNNSLAIPGFSRAGVNGSDLYNGPLSSVFSGWNMLTSIGPVSGTISLLQWTYEPVMTDGGQLVFNDGSCNGTFKAVVGSGVPDAASTLLLTGCALAGLGGLRRKWYS